MEEPPSVEVGAIEEDEDAPRVEGDTTDIQEEEPQAESTAPAESHVVADEELPIENYDSLNIKQISERLAQLSDEEVEHSAAMKQLTKTALHC